MIEWVELSGEAEVEVEVEGVGVCWGGLCTMERHVHTARHTRMNIVRILK